MMPADPNELLRALYEQQHQLFKQLIELGAQLRIVQDTLTQRLQNVDAHVVSVREDIADHEARLRSLEQRKVVTPRSMWQGMGFAMSVLMALLGVAQILMKD